MQQNGTPHLHKTIDQESHFSQVSACSRIHSGQKKKIKALLHTRSQQATDHPQEDPRRMRAILLQVATGYPPRDNPTDVQLPQKNTKYPSTAKTFRAVTLPAATLPAAEL
mmetsp:Transcript_43060/g.101014  ORF Transcript_43060/g.101014 Transcript_43060/m.101014 type:complete len:110 (-) Transcript_43060:619-948(-)